MSTRNICRGIIIIAAVGWLSIMIGIPLYMAADTFGSWGKAVIMLVGCAVTVFGLVGFLTWATIKADW